MCPDCPRRFETEEKLSIHQRLKRKICKWFICSVCEECFSSSVKYTERMETHKTETETPEGTESVEGYQALDIVIPEQIKKKLLAIISLLPIETDPVGDIGDLQLLRQNPPDEQYMNFDNTELNYVTMMESKFPDEENTVTEITNDIFLPDNCDVVTSVLVSLQTNSPQYNSENLTLTTLSINTFSFFL